VTAAAAQSGDLAEKLATGSVATAIGTVAFGADHELRDNPYSLLVWRSGTFMPAETAPESE
jgi:branched-chain amino acid transport system substrate-binding protein